MCKIRVIECRRPAKGALACVLCDQPMLVRRQPPHNELDTYVVEDSTWWWCYRCGLFAESTPQPRWEGAKALIRVYPDRPSEEIEG